MMGIPLAFAAPAVLSALVLLPVIWWLLRLTPPKPRRETFPPTRILLEIAKKEETPSKSPWWLTALRLLLAALVIFALAGPILRPVAEEAPGSGPLLLVVDNGWASARRFDATLDTARRILGIADRESRPVSLLATAEGPGQRLAPVAASEALKRLDALVPRPFASDRSAILPPLGTVTAEAHFGGVAWLSDGLGGPDAEAFGHFISERIDAPVLVYDDRGANVLALKPPTATSEALTVPVIRRDTGAPEAGLLRALDLKGRNVGEAQFLFEPNSNQATAEFTFPAELRNEIVRVEITGEKTAGAVQLLDDRFRRRRIGLLSGASADTAQPLLSPLYYLQRAVSPFADVREPSDANVAKAVPELIAAGVSVIGMADIGTIPKDVEEALAKWVADGGTLVRFAGKRLASVTEDKLTPVRLRQGDRVLGGSLTWETPQPLSSVSPESPFAGMSLPDDIVVQRQVLAEPNGDLPSRTWAALADGTPLVTASPSGKGLLILFHVTADPSWSNLPLSGTFVEMLRRIIAFSHAARATDAEAGGTAKALLPPYRLLDGFGRFTAPTDRAQPIAQETADKPASAERPPGLYGAEDGFRAVNLFDAQATLPAFDPRILSKATVHAYPTESPQDLSPPLFAAALLLLVLDGIAVLWLAGLFRARRRAAAAAAILIALGVGLAMPPSPVRADEASDAFAMKAVQQTHLAYVITGNASIDETSRAGLAGLTRVLADRTALEPGPPIGVDPAKDELAFFPLLYWPIDADAALPSSATLARIDAYMKQGGSILFDTRDQLDRGPGSSGFAGTPAAEKLRDMLATLDIPPLEPVPADHVLTKAFYLLTDFPGRYAGGQLWVEASPKDEASDRERPARAGDGVTTILITGNDLAGAWATDEAGTFLYPTIPSDPLQREMSFRTGVNIVMYTLTGNYKADQVHVPALLERLGQ